MKTFLKTTCIAAVALAMATFGAAQARANGWVVAGGAVGGFAVGTAVGATIATGAHPVYAYPPGHYAPAPVTVALAAPVYYGPRVFAGPYPYYHPYLRYGYGWGPRHYGGRPYYRR